MPSDRTVTVGGKRWRLVYDSLPLPSRTDGGCDMPTEPGKRIVIHPKLTRRPQDLLETLIHEILHASGWPIDEAYVTQAAADCARILWQQGFRLEKPAKTG